MKSVEDDSIKVKFGSWWSWKDDKKGTVELQMSEKEITVDFSFLGELIMASIIMYFPLLFAAALSAYGGIYPVTIIMVLLLLGFLKYHHSCFKKTADTYHFKLKSIVYVLESDEFAFCPDCGNEVDVSDDGREKRCLHCGSFLQGDETEEKVSDESRSTSQPRPGSAGGFGSDLPPERPTGITLLVVLYILGALVGFAGLAYPTLSFLPQILGTIGILIVLFESLIRLVIAYGLWKGLKWAWYGAVVFAVIGLLNLGIGTIINILILFYLFKEEVKTYFRV